MKNLKILNKELLIIAIIFVIGSLLLATSSCEYADAGASDAGNWIGNIESPYEGMVAQSFVTWNGIGWQVLKPVNYAVRFETRDMSDNAGFVTYTGYGFEPNQINIFAKLTSGVGNSIGSCYCYIVPVTFGNFCYYYKASIAALWWDQNMIIRIEPTSGQSQYARVYSCEDDGFTLQWYKTGVPTGIIYMTVIASLGN